MPDAAYRQEWIVGVYAGDPLPLNAEVIRLLQVEEHPYGTGTATRRYYVLLVGQRTNDGARATAAVPMDDYEIANLRTGLEVLRKLGLDTGDWLGQLLNKLPEVEQKPNCTMDDQLKRARVTP